VTNPVSTTVQDVLQDVVEGVATVTLNRPDKLNATTPAMAARVGAALRRCDSDPAVRAIILTGQGRAFCAGADLAVVGGGLDALADFVRDPATFPMDALTIGKPVIAAVRGPVAGVGMAYVAASDLRFAAPDARFTTSFARLGLVGEYGLTWLLPRIVGRSAAADLLLSGRTIDAVEALRIGLIGEIVKDDDVLVRARAYADDLVRNCSPRSMAVIKQQVRDDADSDRSIAFARSLALMLESVQAPDLVEAMAAHADRRPPRFPDLAPTDRSAGT
jgi:enoyl-CoA hydratase/carnithine racemase